MIHIHIVAFFLGSTLQQTRWMNYEAMYAGELDLAGILVGTRQLMWNNSYKVKPQ